MVVTILAAIFVFGLLVLVHEWGHFITAKLTGMRVDEFAIGFGPQICGVKKGETQYSLRAIPLGGYNKIAGMDMDEGETDAGERAYFNRPVWGRMIVILAGSCMNFILPLFLFFGIFFFCGIGTPVEDAVIGEALAGHPAAQAGIQANDRILAINGESVANWKDMVSKFQGTDGKVLEITFERDGETKEATVIPEYNKSQNRSLIGITCKVNYEHPGFFESIGLACQKEVHVLYNMLMALVQLFTGEVPASELSGPIGVAQMAGEVAQLGFAPLLNFAAFLSLNLGIINLLPVPALDGGHFVTLCLEAVRGKPLSQKAMHAIQMVGVGLVLMLMLFATFNDITR